MPLDDPYGPAINNSGVQALAVSQMTEKMAKKINMIRKRRGLKPLSVLSIGMVLAEDFKPISSTRIRAGEIDHEGYLTVANSVSGKRPSRK